MKSVMARTTPMRQRAPDAMLPGDYPDPSVLRVGETFYLTTSSFEYYPGLLIWKSTDLIRWQRVGHALRRYVGSVYAPDLVEHNGIYYIYFPAGGTNWVVTAPHPEGPWSEPIDLAVGHIDPGHAVDEQGRRFLHLSEGYLVPLTADGLAVTGKPEKVYDGWGYPADWLVEGFCLEAPKITRRNGFYYLTVAEGGTAGPATSHMVVSSRALNLRGPWEHSPYNPIVHTASADERWWSKGHGTIFDDPAGRWYVVYHGYEQGYHTLGRQALLERIEWTPDGWFRLRKSASREPIGGCRDWIGLSDDFASDRLGLQWQFWKDGDTQRYTVGGGLRLTGRGTEVGNSSPLLCIPAHHAYEVTCEIDVPDGVLAGLALFYDEAHSFGIGVAGRRLAYCREHWHVDEGERPAGSRLTLKIRNDRHQVSLLYGTGDTFTLLPRANDLSSWHHNAFGGFLSLRIALFAAGQGTAEFRNFRYTAI